mmetsp:Transcript_23847/g.36926  ORF Transcript_23847/g.36926 Transcript_23847/m.36926 type:complete len:84 (+) Transcript_23847:39-290(+)
MAHQTLCFTSSLGSFRHIPSAHTTGPTPHSTDGVFFYQMAAAVGFATFGIPQSVPCLVEFSQDIATEEGAHTIDLGLKVESPS